MKNTGSPSVQWLMIVVAASFLAISLTVLRKSGVRGPLSAAIFLVCEGACALPLLGYFVGLTVTKNGSSVAAWIGVILGALVCTVVFACVRLWQPYLFAYHEAKFGQGVNLLWTQRAAILGCVGMGLFLTEIARLTSRPVVIGQVITLQQLQQQLQQGIMAAGAASAGLVLVEFLALTFCNYFWDFQWKGIVPYNERLASWQCVGVVAVSVGLILVGIMKNYQPYMDRYVDEMARSMHKDDSQRLAKAERKTEISPIRSPETNNLLIADEDENPQFGK